MSASDQKFRMYFGKRPATQEELSHVEEITVEQAMDMAWQATIKIFLCLDEKGKWSHLEDDFMRSFERVRVELQLGTSSWVPLIDGPIVERHADMDSEPGRSTITLTVNDDSVLLNREEDVHESTSPNDSKIARVLFGKVREIAKKDIESTSDRTGTGRPKPMQRGTAMRQLRRLADRHGFHAFVLPGDKPGESIGCFRPDPTRSEGLPELVLLGADRNLSSFQVTDDAQGPTRFRARYLRIKDKHIVPGKSPLQPQGQTATQLLSPARNSEDDPDRAIQAATHQESYSIRATGSVLPGGYAGVLRPYQIVSIRAGPAKSSGNYLLTKATHRITPSLYTQKFEAKRNGVEETNSVQGFLSKIS